MQRLLLLGSRKSWHTRELLRAAETRIGTDVCSFKQLCASIGNTLERETPIDTAHQYVLVRAMPPGSLEQIVFRMDALAICEQRGAKVVNPPKALELAVDKYLSLAKFSESGLLVPPTFVCQTAEEAMEGFNVLGSDVVVKPLFGGEGRSLMRIDNEDLAWRAFRWLEQAESVIYIQKFVANRGRDWRVLCIGSKQFSIERSHATDWRNNVTRGATAKRVELDRDQSELANRAMAVSGCLVAGVDLIQDLDGRTYLLEINAVPGWKAVQDCHQTDIASMIIDEVVGKL